MRMELHLPVSNAALLSFCAMYRAVVCRKQLDFVLHGMPGTAPMAAALLAPTGSRDPAVPVNTSIACSQVFLEVQTRGGYDACTCKKQWRSISKTLGHDISTQTSVSHIIRTHYERCGP